MCGLSGIISNSKVPRQLIESMTAVLGHRGPDSSGIWLADDGCAGLGHQRLSVIDLSSTGSQPMHSSCNRYCIIYNGEIYNANEIRQELQQSGRTFRGSSDTEVILESCAAIGVEESVRRLVGMFAFALWDKQQKVLYLVRDRLGIKPLYWGHFGGLFIFASELKSLRKHPGWKVEISPTALSTFMQYAYVPAPLSIYKGIFKLSPGSILKVKHGSSPEIYKYWTMEDVVANGKSHPLIANDEELISSTEKILEEAVASRMMADVPLGAFLSGGIDSSTVVALMQKNSMHPVKTFSIGFHEKNYNEADHAAYIARHLGTEHTEFYVTSKNAMDVIPLIPDMYDEPFADSSQIPTYLVSKLTSEHVTVALSGDGGDEVFAGYNRYYLADKLINKLVWLTPMGRYILRKTILTLPPRYWTNIFSKLPTKMNVPLVGDKLYKFADIIQLDKKDVYTKLVSHWCPPDTLVLNGGKSVSLSYHEQALSQIDTLIEQMQYQDLVRYLPDDILTKVDRASMAVSLEVRVPFLDHRLIEHAWRLPLSCKVRHGQGKWLLRQVLHKYVPSHLVERPKMGFGVPLDSWLRGPLREWAETLLDSQKLKSQGLLNAEIITKKWTEHLSGERNWQYQLWNVLMFQAWHEQMM
ncbi:MAG: asparagine synthase (glutamine-hydrolyzing) [Gammaproteobacteria bacterium]|jgi:asparagine synthase (glutamine-hydrolysing)